VFFFYCHTGAGLHKSLYGRRQIRVQRTRGFAGARLIPHAHFVFGVRYDRHRVFFRGKRPRALYGKTGGKAIIQPPGHFAQT